MEKYKERLVSSGIKPTFQRIKIMEYLDQNRTHPTADAVYNALYQKVPTLSKTTVYNTIDILKKHQLVTALSITGYETRFDYNIENHQHFLCQKCNQIFDVQLELLPQNLSELDGHIVKEAHFYFKGICRHCRNGSERE
jgi:Fe2+ or Zn2+ uptake regulation protein